MDYKDKYTYTVASWPSKSVKELQSFLQNNEIQFSNHLKVGLVKLSKAAEELGIDNDLDGLENQEEIISLNLTLARCAATLSHPTLLDNYIKNVAILQQVNILDIYNYLISFRDHEQSPFCDYKKWSAMPL